MSEALTQFCPKCGREESTELKFIKGFCIDCFLEDDKLASIPKETSIPFCPRCLNIRVKGKWLQQSKKVLESIVLSNIQSKLVNPVYSIQLEEIKGEKVKAFISIKGSFEGIDLIFNLETFLVPVKVLCDACMRQSSDYWEALLQLRFQEKTPEQALSNRFKQVTSLLESFKAKDKLSFLLKADTLKNGFDFYIGSNKAARKIARLLEKESKQKITISFKLHGIDEHGKPKRRLTYAVRL